jgi:hypothetical protein
MAGGQQGCDARRRGTEGAVFVEFLIAFLPVLTTFLCLCQLALLFAVKLVVEHAAVNAARTAAVVIGDDPKAYSGSVEPLHQVQKNGARYTAIERSAVLSLAPLIANGTILNVNVMFPAPNDPGGKDQGSPRWSPMANSNIDKVRVRVEATALCKIGLANRIECGGLSALLGYPTRTVRAEAVYPYQGASYDYP